MPKDDFIDILESSDSEDENSPDDEGTLSTIIKNEEMTADGSEKLITEEKVIESESFTLKLFKKEDFIDNIEIECRCGRSANIQLEYEAPVNEDDFDDSPDTAISDGPAPDVPQASNIVKSAEFIEQSADSPEAGSELPEETDEEFREGIPAAVVSSDTQEELAADDADISDETVDKELEQ